MVSLIETAAPVDPDSIADDGWFKTQWRPAMAWQYFTVCICDFILFPIGHAGFLAAWGVRYTEWHPLTLQGGGLYHIAMGAVVGVTAWTRTQEKKMTFDAVTGGTSSVVETTSRQVKVSNPPAADDPAALPLAPAAKSPRAD